MISIRVPCVIFEKLGELLTIDNFKCRSYPNVEVSFKKNILKNILTEDN